ncbi:TonB-dependent receptor [Winogradskyella litoriviva]|uniref:TonB-dependent receptor n=1 Tax=Winogradskyella litoriviva TaxID=1220182 RepID=A0ABX2E1E6_9FLAO|nr:TonB-dependent receptor [Winogradskyella litoriviva]NRD22242.1 TonB-dependent receptor [Winogradskyella litoriviva]
MKTKFSLLLMLFFSICAFAQQIDINGIVTTESDGMPLPGANVLIKGTNRGTTTDFDGKFTIKASRGEQIEFSYIGLETQIILIENQTELNIALKDDVSSLSEVVVIGYGSQKKADLTSAIATINPEELKATPSAQLVQGFQGKVAGVQISSIGSPGETPEVRIRGANSLAGDSSPLYVVDGMFYDSIDFLNPSEIENVSILKDASSSAIYGVKAANGVILITTKGGRFNKKPEISFSTYYGFQNAQNVLKMANAEQFVTFAQESGSASEISSVEQAIQRFGRSRINPNIPDVNTDWYDEVLRVASIENYDLQVNGGSESVSYSLGGNFFLQDGILDMKNSYERFNIRAKVDAKAADWLNVGGNILYSNAVKYDDEASAWQLTYYAVPILPVYDYNFVDADPTPYSDAREVGYRGSQNPFPLLDNSDRRGERRRTTANFYADFKIIPDHLSFKTTFSYNYLGTNERIMLLPYYITDDYQRSIDNSSITRTNSVVENYIFDNVLTYTNSFGEHDLTVMAGTSFRDDYYRTFWASGNFDPGGAFLRDNEQTWYIQNTAEDSRTASDGGSRYYGMSYFGRAQYKFKDKYLAYATFRSEGSNKYENTYVNLPAFGLGWEISKESFMEDINFINYLKLRAGWGKLANNAVGASIPISASTISTVFNDTYYNGFQFSTVADDVDWEYTEELNVGLSANLFNNRLSLEADYFVKDTENLVINIEPLVGTEVSSQNAGSVRNQGIELAATWNGQISEDFGYTVSGNFSTIDNEITGLAGQPYLNTGTAEARQRLIVGEAINSFYGYEIEGVYQNTAEVDADPNVQAIIADGTAIEPGYFRYRDLNNDGTIDANDRKVIGSPVPTYYFGGNIGLNYKGFELNVAFYGQGGNVILNTNRMEVIRTQGRNIDAELAINRWHGEGTTNKFPSSEGYRSLWNQKLSEFFLQDGDFFRIQNIQLAYTLKEEKLPEMRFTLTADRPILWTKGYNGFNPEVGFDGRDTQTYPTPSVYTFGVTVKF